MKIKKYFILLILLIFCTSGIMAENCKPAYRNVRKISKNKKTNTHNDEETITYFTCYSGIVRSEYNGAAKFK